MYNEKTNLKIKQLYFVKAFTLILLFLAFLLVSPANVLAKQGLSELTCIGGDCEFAILSTRRRDLNINFRKRSTYAMRFFIKLNNTKSISETNGFSIILKEASTGDLISQSFIREPINSFNSFRATLKIPRFLNSKNYELILQAGDQSIISRYSLSLNSLSETLLTDEAIFDCQDDTNQQECAFDEFVFSNLRFETGNQLSREVSISRLPNSIYKIDLPTPLAKDDNNFKSGERIVRRQVVYKDAVQLTSAKRLGIGKIETPKARLDIKANTRDYAPLLLNASVLTNNLIDGALEFDGGQLYFTSNGLRKPLLLEEFSTESSASTISSADITDGSILLKDLNFDVKMYLANIAQSVQGFFRDGSVTPVKLAGGLDNPAANLYYGTDESGDLGFHSLNLSVESENISGNTIDFSEVKKAYKLNLSQNTTLNFTNLNQGHSAVLEVDNNGYDLSLPAYTELVEGDFENDFNKHYILIDVYNVVTGNEIVEARIFNTQARSYENFDDIEALYSLVRAAPTYTGDLIKIRRSSGGTLDVGFDSEGELDIDAVETFCAGVGVTCFVETWYDQSGNGNDAIQANTANQPMIADDGVIFTSSTGKPGIKANNTEMSLIFEINSISNSDYSIFIATERHSDRSAMYPITQNGNYGDGNLIFMGWSTETNFGFYQTNNNISFTDNNFTVPDLQVYSAMHLANNEGLALYVDSNLQAENNNSAKLDIQPGEKGYLFTSYDEDGFYLFEGIISEFVMYSSDRSENRDAIEYQMKINTGLLPKNATF
jgi:hypothetical protein